MSQQWQIDTDDRDVHKQDGLLGTCPACGKAYDPTDGQCAHDRTSVSAEFELIERLFEGRYGILSRIASGGMGTVYKAVQRSLGKTVAIKMLRSPDKSPAMWTRFQQEAKTASLLTHPNIIHIDDFGATTDGQPYMVMDLIDGTDLAALIESERRIRPPEAIAIILQVCSAMQHAHGRGVLHRDLKPSNIMLFSAEGQRQVKIVDFGIAKFMNPGQTQAVTQTGEIFGSPYYMSPEQVLGKALDQRSDVYSLGCILYEALTGSTPFSGNSAFETMMKQTAEKPVPIQDLCPRENFSDALQQVVLKSLEKEQAQRFQTMAAFEQALSAVPEAQGRQARTLNLGRTVIGINSSNRRKFFKVSLLLVLIIFLALSGYFVFFHNQAAVEQGGGVAAPFSRLRRAVADPNSMLSFFSAAAPVALKGTPSADKPVLFEKMNDEELKSELADLVRNKPTVSEVFFRDCAINDQHLQQLKPLNLRRLVIQDSTALSDQGLKVLTEFPHLQCFSVLESRPDDRAKKAHPLTNAKITDNVFETIGQLKELSILELCGQLSVTGEKLVNLPMSLKHLDLSYDQHIDPELLKGLDRLSNLRALILDHTAITDTSLKDISPLKLHALDLTATPISDNGIQFLARMPLTTLGLKNTNIGPKSIPVLCKISTLQLLDLSDTNCGVDERGLLRRANDRLQISDIHLR
jgi:serine/threonine-protein kinase